MALKKSFTESANVVTFVSGWGDIEANTKKVLIENCYIKVESISGTKDLIKIQVSLTASTLKSKKSYEFTPSMDGGNFIKQAYEHLKTLPDFDGAMDC